MLAGCGRDTKTAEEPAAPVTAEQENKRIEVLLGYCDLPDSDPVRVEGKTYKAGSNVYPEERPVRSITVNSFDIDRAEVTNAQFRAFIEATDYVTVAERPQDGFDALGGAVFVEPTAENPAWWQFIEGANWRHPEGPNSTIEGFDNYPVVQVAYEDAKTYAKWAGRRLPSEAEWELAAGMGKDSVYVWGDERNPDGKILANTWQGAFPVENTVADGFAYRAPVGCFEPNGYGLHDMIGNVWEWTDTVFQETTGEAIHVIKGGSFLCAENYCQRYRAAARQPQEVGLPTNHIGFRTAGDVE